MPATLPWRAVDITITGVDVTDVRFPTSRTLAGSDAMNAAPDYSAAYVVLTTDSELTGHGMTFTIGRGTEIVVTAIDALEHLVVGRDLDDSPPTPARSGASVTGDTHLRWIGPEKGVDPPGHRGAASTPCGTCGRAPRASRCGSSSPT